MARPNWEYIRVDVLLPESRKLDDLSYAARWTLIELWCHCGKHLTDGFVRDAIWRKTGTPKVRQELIDADLAERADGGYQMHDYLEHQRSRADVTELKKKRSEAGRRGGMAKANAKQVPQQEPDNLPGKPVAEAEAEAEEELSPASDDAGGDVRDDVDRLCTHLASRIEGNGSKRPAITSRWRDAARLMLDRDGRTEQQVHAAIDWSQDHEFWRPNILSMPKLRDKYDQLRLQASRPGATPSAKSAILTRAMERAEKKESSDANGNGQASGLHQRMLPPAGHG